MQQAAALGRHKQTTMLGSCVPFLLRVCVCLGCVIGLFLRAGMPASQGNTGSCIVPAAS